MRSAGNLKFDFNPPAFGIAADILAFLNRQQSSAIWIAASTMPPKEASDPDEDDAVIAAFSSLNRPGLLLILAPRHPQRFEAVAQKLARAGIRFARRTSLSSAPGNEARVLLLDSIGDLAALFARADIVFMGGTLASRGGHNILEPAYFAKPVIAGPHMENFALIAHEFTAAKALVRISDAEELAAAVANLLDNPALSTSIGSKAHGLAESKRGVADHIASEINTAVGQGVPNPLRTLAERVCLAPLSWIWRAGHRVNFTSAKPLALPVKVVSVGALAMGGVGKTPVVAHLAERIASRGTSGCHLDPRLSQKDFWNHYHPT